MVDMTPTWVRRHSNGVNALVVYVGGIWRATNGGGEFHVACATLDEAKAVTDERVGAIFPHDCDECPSWEHPPGG
jgi:hypothetical protein